jgi:hypothetical protein
MQHDERNRLRVIAGVVLFIAVLFMARLYLLQVSHHDQFTKEAESQYIATLPNLYDRGSIYFTEKDGKRIAAATVGSGFVIAITPKLVESPQKTYDLISTVVSGIDHDEFMAKALKKNDPYEEIATKVPESEALALKRLDLPGFQIFRQTWRFYPGASLAAQTVGFVGYKGSELTGRYGLESYYDDTLTRNSDNLYVNFFAELFTNMPSAIAYGFLSAEARPTPRRSVELAHLTVFVSRRCLSLAMAVLSRPAMMNPVGESFAISTATAGPPSIQSLRRRKEGRRSAAVSTSGSSVSGSMPLVMLATVFTRFVRNGLAFSRTSATAKEGTARKTSSAPSRIAPRSALAVTCFGKR